MKGYKASLNKMCFDQLYEVGHTYKIQGELKICKNGFHFCENIDDVLEYYDPNQELVIFEVEALGELITEDDKSVTDEIKIIRKIPVSEWNELFKKYKFDDRKNLIYQKHNNGDEWHYKYDKNNNKIYQKNPNGRKWHWRFDENNNLIYRKDSYGYEWDLKKMNK